MKARLFSLLFVALASATALVAADRGYVPMKIIQTEPVMYPRDVMALGVVTGEAQIALQVDEKGNLTDSLVIGYTHKSFADAAMNALKKWKFEPAYIAGEPHSATMNLTFAFETKGIVVVNLTVNNVIEVQKLSSRSDYYGSWACTLSQLDRIPTPSKVIKPRYPLVAKQTGKAATVTVHFYIDQQGHVRLPAVDREISEQLDPFAAEALDAISQWQFEPPLSHGRPVLVSAQQDFNFHSNP